MKLYAQAPSLQDKGTFSEQPSFSLPWTLTCQCLLEVLRWITSICLPYGVACDPVDQPCAYAGPGSFYILLPVTKLMVSLKGFSLPGCSVSSSGWPGAHFRQVHVSVLKILVPPTHPGLLVFPVPLCSLHILNSHINILSVSTPGSLRSPHQSAVMFLAISLVPGSDFPPIQR